MPADEFDPLFSALTGNEPFPWQRSLFEEFATGNFPARCDIPTGLGKTSIICIWLLAAADRIRRRAMRNFPRRLVYVVNRRTVVDQATREAEGIREKLQDPKLQGLRRDLRSLGIRDARGLAHLEAPLAISTLRGQFADNAEWRADPARLAIIVGTVDMIGSRILFSGYGRGFKSRPLHAGFLAQDTLLVHDEAHLEPAFQELITAIESEQRKAEGTPRDSFGQLRVVALTATSRGADSAERPAFTLGNYDREHSVVRQRIDAKKGIKLHPMENGKLAEQIAALALGHQPSGQAILVFVRTVEDVDKVVKKLPKGSYVTLTGTMRGLERDKLREHPVFARFDPKADVSKEQVQQGTVYLVCTSAGEVGVDISAEHLVCDLTPFDSMAQRFGRVNRYGNGIAKIDVVYENEELTNDAEPGHRDASSGGKKTEDAFDLARQRTLALLRKLPRLDMPEALQERHDASPDALGKLAADERREAFTPPPTIVPVSDILLDAWALTSIREKLPGRPPVADWLHGMEEWEPPQTHVAWREEVELVAGEMLDQNPPEDLLDEYPLKPHELLRDQSNRVLKHLERLAESHPQAPVWVITQDGAVDLTTLSRLAEKTKRDLARDKRNPLDGTFVVLPPSVGGLDVAAGRLDSTEPYMEASRERYDVADKWDDEDGSSRRQRVWDRAERPQGMRLVRAIRFREDDAETEETDDEPSAERRRVWSWYVRPASADDEGSQTAIRMQTLRFHLGAAEHFARELVAQLGLKEPEASAVLWGARYHDLGKDRLLWQRSIGNDDPDRVLAKSGGKVTRETGYRHEFGSLFDVENESEFGRLSDEAKDLARHFIAAHHGRARPHFPEREIFDPRHSEKESVEVAREVPRRFARLQQTYGRWGLAYLESLVRAADALASQLEEGVREATE